VSWSHGLNEKVIAEGLAKGCEAMVVGYFVDNAWEGSDGKKHYGKELVIQQLRVLDWASRADQRAAA
jgi:single-strand DNA-binding protein